MVKYSTAQQKHTISPAYNNATQATHHNTSQHRTEKQSQAKKQHSTAWHRVVQHGISKYSTAQKIAENHRKEHQCMSKSSASQHPTPHHGTEKIEHTKIAMWFPFKGDNLRTNLSVSQSTYHNIITQSSKTQQHSTADKDSVSRAIAITHVGSDFGPQ